MRWIHLPIVDGAAPTHEWEQLWLQHGPYFHNLLDHGSRLLIHCLGGRGRTGTVAARLLIERGAAAEQAIAAIRQARDGAIETPEQLAYLRVLGD
jgi:protein-tyrosine phosphatase